MNTLLIFFAIPVAVIIFSIVLQKLLQSPLLVAATIFAILLLVTFTAFDESFLVFAILYTLLALITALLVRFLCCLINNSDNPCINGSAMNNGICGNNSANDDDDDENDNSNNSCCGCNRGNTNQYTRRNFMRR